MLGLVKIALFHRTTCSLSLSRCKTMGCVRTARNHFSSFQAVLFCFFEKSQRRARGVISQSLERASILQIEHVLFERKLLASGRSTGPTD